MRQNIIFNFIHYITLVICLTIGGNAYAQRLNGVVTDFDGNFALEGVAVANAHTNAATVTDESGRFSIAAHEGDTITFAYLGYYPFSLLMPAGENLFRKLALKKQLIALGEVEIRPDLTPYQLDSLERRAMYRQALSQRRVSSSFGGAVASPVSALAEQFNKKTKQVKQFQENYVKWEDQKFTETRYTTKVVQQLTGLTGDTLATFMNAYPLSADYARVASDLEIKMWIKFNYKEWSSKPIMLPPPIPDADTSKNGTR
ncbi:MAG: carboxypeptidase-like regulatory domain-containing protein [Edaphocola sp.]